MLCINTMTTVQNNRMKKKLLAWWTHHICNWYLLFPMILRHQFYLTRTPKSFRSYLINIFRTDHDLMFLLSFSTTLLLTCKHASISILISMLMLWKGSGKQRKGNLNTWIAGCCSENLKKRSETRKKRWAAISEWSALTTCGRTPGIA